MMTDLQLVLALDHARDSLTENGDPQRMFEQITALLRDHFAAEACALLLLDEQIRQPVSLTAEGLAPEAALALCQDALGLDSPAALPNPPEETHTLGVQIRLHGDALGSVVLLRSGTAFTDAERERLAIAESQLDSAALQARTIWKLAQRNHELEAIFQLDRLRDSITDEPSLLAGFVRITRQFLHSPHCLVIVAHIDGGDLVGASHDAGLTDDLKATLIVYAAQVKELQTFELPDTALFWIAAPLIVSGVRLGVLVAGRADSFTSDDRRLLAALVSQMDSAVAHVRVIQQLQQRSRELETIYRIDQIRDRENDFDLMLYLVLNELCSAIRCELGYIMLYNARGEEQLELRATTAGETLRSPEYYEVISRVSREALDQGTMVNYSHLEGTVHSIIAVPLILNDRIIGVFGVLNHDSDRGFNAEDRRMLLAITSQVDTAIFERLERRRMRKVMSRSVDPKVLDHLLQYADDHLLAGERVTLTTIFADVRGSTEWAERTAPEDLVATINAFLGRMTDVIFRYGGTLDKFVGDEVIGMFGTPLPMADHAYYACKTALEMQRVHGELQAELNTLGRELPAIGVGVSSGEAIAGEFGAPARTDFTAMGRIVNLGARLCSAAKPGQVLISQTTYELLAGRGRVHELEPILPKGITHPVRVFELLEISEK